VDSYDRAVESLVGSPQLFFTGVFRCQDALRLSDYTKGEMKAVFVELLSIETLKDIGLRAKARKDDMLKDKEWLEREKARLSSVVEAAEKAKSEVALEEANARDLEKEIILLKEKIEKKREDLRKLEAQAALHEKALGEKSSLEKALKDLKVRKEKAESVLSKAAAVKEAVTKENHLACKMDLVKKEIVRLDERIAEYERQERVFRESERRLHEARRKLSEINLRRDHQRETLKRELQRTKEAVRLLGDVPCPAELHEKCAFLKKAVKERGDLPGLVSRLRSLEKPSEDVLALEAEIKKLETSLLPFKEMLKEKAEVLKKRNDERVSSLKAEETLKKARVLAALLPEVEFSEATLPGLLAEIKEIEEKLEPLSSDKSCFSDDLRKEKAAILVLERKREDLEEELRKTTGRLAVHRKAMTDGENAAKEIAALDERMKALSDDVSEWIILEKAFGDNGIIALEIDDAGPSISAVANDLLLSCFGPRFSVRIDTQAVKAGGKGLKETFDIVVFDSERDESKSLKVMSGGEKVWIEEAVTRAICLYNAGKSGRKFQTLFTDEKDGALDFRRKKEFMAMKRKALEIGGFDMEFFISQSPEIQELADYTINMSEVA